MNSMNRLIVMAVFIATSTVGQAKGEDEPRLVRAVYERVDGEYLWSLRNVSDTDLLIRDLKVGLARACGNQGDPFLAHKEWIYLRKSGSALTTDYISIRYLDTIRGIGATRDNGDIVVSLHIATFDPDERRLGEWKKIKVVFEWRPDDGATAE